MGSGFLVSSRLRVRLFSLLLLGAWLFDSSFHEPLIVVIVHDGRILSAASLGSRVRLVGRGRIGEAAAPGGGASEALAALEGPGLRADK